MSALIDLVETRDGETSTGPRGAALVWLVATVLFIVFVATGHYENHYGTDPLTNAAQARAFADDQHWTLEELEGFAAPRFQGNVAWFEEGVDGPTSKYPPGAAVWAAPLYLLDTSLEQTSFLDPDDPSEQIEVPTPSTYVPATVAASLSVAVALGFGGLTLLPLLPARGVLLAMVTGGLGTGAWSVASDRLWQHGPAMMCISIGTYFASKERFVAAGLAFGAGILVRPHTAVVGAMIGLVVAGNRRSVGPALAIGATSFVGVVLLVLYNHAVFGDLSVSGGYSSGFADRVVDSSPLLLVQRMGEMFVHFRVGLSLIHI